MRLISLFLFAIIIFSPIRAQNLPPSDAKTHKETNQQAELKQKALALLDSVIEDAAALKLSENKASIYAEAAALIWQFDEKRARSLFQLTAEELNFLLSEFEDDSPEDEFNFLEFRKRILRQAASFDVDLAFEMMKQTRPPELEAAMNAETTASQDDSTENSGTALQAVAIKQRVLAERQLESDLIAKSAESNSQRALQLLKEGVGAKVSPRLLAALQKLREKDEKATAQIANEALRKLLAAPLSLDLLKEDKTADYFLIYLTNSKTDKKDKPLQIDEVLLQQLAVKVADSYLQSGGRQDGVVAHDLSMVLPALEKFVSEKTTQKLRETLDAWRKGLPSEVQKYFQVEQYYRKDVSVEKVLADAGALPAAQQKTLYNVAFYKLIQAKDYARARQLLQTKFAAKESEEMSALLSNLEVEHSLSQDNLALAKNGLTAIRDKHTKVRLLIATAKGYVVKNTKEDKATALKLLDDARRLIDATPESEDEIEPFLQVVGGYAAVEPDTAFKLITPVILTMNDLMQAGALVRKFVKNKQEFRKGEFILGTSEPEYKRFIASYQKDLRLLAISDFERTNNLIGKFTRPEAQISARLYIAQSILREKPTLEDETLQITNNNGITMRIGLY